MQSRIHTLTQISTTNNSGRGGVDSIVATKMDLVLSLRWKGSSIHTSCTENTSRKVGNLPLLRKTLLESNQIITLKLREETRLSDALAQS